MHLFTKPPRLSNTSQLSLQHTLNFILMCELVLLWPSGLSMLNKTSVFRTVQEI